MVRFTIQNVHHWYVLYLTIEQKSFLFNLIKNLICRCYRQNELDLPSHFKQMVVNSSIFMCYILL